MSASAPAGGPKINIGSVVATCTSETIRGSGLRPVISHPAAAFCIQVPILEITVAVQSTANARCRNGLHGDGGAVILAPAAPWIKANWLPLRQRPEPRTYQRPGSPGTRTPEGPCGRARPS